MITDAVVHIWQLPLNPQFHHRTDPTSAEQLMNEMDSAGVDRAVLVPPFSIENTFGIESAALHADRFRVMPVIDPRLPEAGEAVNQFASQPTVVGYRVVFHTKQQVADLEGGELETFWTQAEILGKPVAAFAPGLTVQMSKVAERHPALRLLIDHLGVPLRLRGKELIDELKKTIGLAGLPNVGVKASGLPTNSESAFPFLDLHDPMAALVDAFGPERIFWGSDISRLSCTYREAVEMMSEVISDDAVRRLLMGEALSHWIGWPEPAMNGSGSG
jgi:predicted TIM-barrel fold metal-dependent hydrolase